MSKFKFKIAVWSVVGVLILLFFLHNQGFFMTRNSFDINVIGIPSLAEVSPIFMEYKTPEIPNVLIFLIFFLFGVLVTYMFYLFGWMRSKRALKRMSCDCESMTQKIEELEMELDAARRSGGSGPIPVGPDVAEETELSAQEDMAADDALRQK